MRSVLMPSRPDARRRQRLLVMSLAIVACACCASVGARPMVQGDARRVAQGWLRTSGQALDVRMSRDVAKVDSYTDDGGAALYHVAYLKPSGFVVTSADDEIEPIIAFADDGMCEFSENNPLFVLVTQDLHGRMSSLTSLPRGGLRVTAEQAGNSHSEARSKWRRLMEQTGVQMYSATAEGSGRILSDVRVPPLLSTRWNQSSEHGYSCYNYFTPQLQGTEVVFKVGEIGNYPCGCAATATAQLLYYHRYPQQAPGQSEYTIAVACDNGGPDYEVPVLLHGGDLKGGPYNWDLMPAEPTENATEEQRQAIGALCADAGAAVHMTYGVDASGTSMESIAPALRDTFRYSNAVLGIDMDDQYIYDLSAQLQSMMNPNLDAGLPVILCLLSVIGGHAIVADGYGYNHSSAYYHLNMGWSGVDDAWYNLPHVSTYRLVGACIYNIFPRDTGEIVSGRVIDRQGRPVSGATVTLTGGGNARNVTTNERGLYAFTTLAPGSPYRISVSKPGCTFTPEERLVATGRSVDSSPSCGNVWAVEFTQIEPGEAPDTGEDATGSIETFDDGRTAGQLDWITDWLISDTAWTSPGHSMRSKAIGDSESSLLSVTLDCRAGDVSFYFKVSSETGCDYLTFFIDGRRQGEWSGEEDWQYVSFPVAAGRHSLQWEYAKDYMFADGDDCAWLDDITLPML